MANSDKPDKVCSAPDLKSGHELDAFHEQLARSQGLKIVQPSDLLKGLKGCNESEREAAFVAQEKGLIRSQFGLGANSSSEDVYHAMAKSGFDNVNSGHYNKHFVDDSLKQLGLKRDGLTLDKYFDALVAFHKKEAGVGPNASYEELEQASHKMLYKQLKTNTIPVDTD